MNIIQVYKKFPTHEDCIKHLEAVAWKGKPICPYCKAQKSTEVPKELRHHCNNCNTSFSVTVGTIFHKTKCDLQKWFLAISLVLNAKKGISARQLSRDIEVTKDTAWYMVMRIRKAFKEYGELLEGICEIDETYIGGKPRGNVGNNKRGRGTDKIPVVGIVERNGKVIAKIIKAPNAKTLTRMVKENVNVKIATMISDEYKGYSQLKSFMTHNTINHSEEYVNGDIHTNTIEGFWALLKRGIVGQYHKLSAYHLSKYLDEFCFRYNNRKNEFAFDVVIAKGLGV